MPYLPKARKKLIHNQNYETSRKLIIDLDVPNCGGDLNYLFTIILVDYLKKKGLNYNNASDITKALDNCKHEFYHRILAKYELVAIERNGDVYPPLEELIDGKKY